MQNVLNCARLKNDANGNAILDHISCYGTRKKMQNVLKDYFSMSRCVQLKYMFEDIFIGTKYLRNTLNYFCFVVSISLFGRIIELQHTHIQSI